MVEEIHIKRIELTDSQKAVIKSNWKEDAVDIEIYIKEVSAVYTGSCSQEALRKKQDLNIKYEAIKDSLTLAEVQENVSYELDYKKLKFSVVSQQMCDSDASFGEIVYVKFDLTSLNLTEMAALSMQLVDEMLDSNQTVKKFKAELSQCKTDLKEMLDRYKELAAIKMEFDKTTLQDVTSIINSKKTRISVLERKLQNSTDIKGNKFANLSSDFDHSDISMPEVKVVKAVKKSSKPILSSSSDDDQQANPQPSTSTAHISPAHLKVDSSHNSPKKIALRRTPKKAFQPVFQFTKFHDSDDSMEELQHVKSRPKLKTPKKSSNHESIFANMKIRVTPKSESLQEQNPSSAELFVPKATARRRLHSSSSDNSSHNCRKESSSTVDIVEPAQVLDFEKQSPKQPSNESSKNQGPKNNSEELFKSDDEMQFTQNLDLSEVEEVENSQPFDSPSIFETYAKRKLRQSPRSANKRLKIANKSKFSDDTIDILADDSL